MSGIRHLPTRIAPAGPAHDPYRAYLARGKVERSRAVRAAFAALARGIASLAGRPAAPAPGRTRTA
jgi:hypothetical protein